MTFTDTDISIFAGLINANDISVAEVINWAYAQMIFSIGIKTQKRKR